MSISFKWYGDNVFPKIKGNRDRALLAAALAFQGQARLYVPKKTHALERSIALSPIIEESIYVGTPLKYAPYVEYGTRYMAPRSYFRRTIDTTKGVLMQIFKLYLGNI